MIKNHEKLVIFRNWELSIGLIISLFSHILLFTVFDFKNDDKTNKLVKHHLLRKDFEKK